MSQTRYSTLLVNDENHVTSNTDHYLPANIIITSALISNSFNPRKDLLNKKYYGG
jgi:hypothetical protein